MAGPNVSHVDLSETFYEWLDITNNVVTLVNKGVYIDGIPTDPNANVIIDGSLSVHQFDIANNTPRFYLKNGNNVNLGYIGYDQAANTIEIFSVAANTSLKLYANCVALLIVSNAPLNLASPTD